MLRMTMSLFSLHCEWSLSRKNQWSEKALDIEGLSPSQRGAPIGVSEDAHLLVREKGRKRQERYC